MLLRSDTLPPLSSLLGSGAAIALAKKWGWATRQTLAQPVSHQGLSEASLSICMSAANVTKNKWPFLAAHS